MGEKSFPIMNQLSSQNRHQKNNQKFWNMKNLANNKGELTLYGTIAESSWWDDVVSSKQFAKDLKALGDITELDVRINSGGGDVFAANAIHSQLKSHKAQVNIYIDGLAASAASVIAMAGDKVYMPANSIMMIHNPWTIVLGESKDMEKAVEMLNKVKDSIIAAYEAKTGLSKEELSDLMDAETWMTGQDAVDKGFADEVLNAAEISASFNGSHLMMNGLDHDLSKFKNLPSTIIHNTPQPQTVQNDSGPMFDVGSRVDVNIDPPHMEGQSAGEVREAVLTWVYGIVFDGMEDMGIHKWYVESELSPASDDSDAQNKKKKKKMDMPGMENSKDKKSQKGAITMDLNKLKQDHPELYNQILQEGVSAERSRIQAIEEMGVPGTEEILNKAKFETGDSVEQVAMNIIKSQKEQGSSFLQNRQQDANPLGQVQGGHAPENNSANHAELEAAASQIAGFINYKRGGVK